MNNDKALLSFNVHLASTSRNGGDDRGFNCGRVDDHDGVIMVARVIMVVIMLTVIIMLSMVVLLVAMVMLVVVIMWAVVIMLVVVGNDGGGDIVGNGGNVGSG